MCLWWHFWSSTMCLIVLWHYWSSDHWSNYASTLHQLYVLIIFINCLRSNQSICWCLASVLQVHPKLCGSFSTKSVCLSHFMSLCSFLCHSVYMLVFLPQDSYSVDPLLSFSRLDKHTRTAENNKRPSHHEKIIWFICWTAGDWANVVSLCYIHSLIGL